jgi:hypothetical protein
MNTQIDSQLTFTQVMDDFLNLLLDEGEMGTVSPEVRAQMLNDLRLRLNEKMFVSILSRLDDEKVTKFRELIEGKAPGEEIEKFIDGNIPDAQDFFSQVFLTFRNDYLGLE